MTKTTIITMGISDPELGDHTVDMKLEGKSRDAVLAFSMANFGTINEEVVTTTEIVKETVTETITEIDKNGKEVEVEVEKEVDKEVETRTGGPRPATPQELVGGLRNWLIAPLKQASAAYAKQQAAKAAEIEIEEPVFEDV